MTDGGQLSFTDVTMRRHYAKIASRWLDEQNGIHGRGLEEQMDERSNAEGPSVSQRQRSSASPGPIAWLMAKWGDQQTCPVPLASMRPAIEVLRSDQGRRVIRVRRGAEGRRIH